MLKENEAGQSPRHYQWNRDINSSGGGGGSSTPEQSTGSSLALKLVCIKFTGGGGDLVGCQISLI